MAGDAVVRRALRAMGAATGQRYYTDEDEATALITFAGALGSYSDDAVNMAADEWARTMTKFPALVEFVDLVRKKAETLIDRTALGGMAPRVDVALGRPGVEGIAAQLVIQRMLDAVARKSPRGYLGRARGLSSDRDCETRSQAELGHTFTAEGHDPECQRCWDFASIAYEQAIEFPGSTLTEESWMADSVEGLRSCRNTACDHGWVTVGTMEGGRVVERQHKCPTCEGPRAPRAKVEAKADGGEVKVPRSRSKGRWHR